MNKTELIELIAKNAELSKREAHNALEAIFAVITENLKVENEVAITKFGTFKISHRASREGFNPLTKIAISIAASKIPTFKAGKSFKEAIK
ncbi:MAG: DNA-binding protein HU-alpha [Mycoplasmataceae bacterium]|nr:MAG: DNA-binding protein HU-alpha [Mycoplasmataceae bacterium]